MQDADRRFLWIIAVAFLPFAALMTLLLTSVFGSSDMGIRCSRAGGGRCEIQRSRLLGAAGNSSFEIPESRISAARASCGQHFAVSGRRSSSCGVELVLADQPASIGPVLSYPFYGQAQSATRKLNAYLKDPSVPSIVLREPVGYLWLLYGGVPVVTLALSMALRARLRDPG